VNAVTGCFSYTGSHIARRLLDEGQAVRTLSRAESPGHPLAGRVEFARLQFDSAIELIDALRGIDTLYNTYWIRFERGRATWQSVVDNTSMLMRAAGAAGVSRVVHVSVTNPDAGSDLLYYRHKAFVEEVVRQSPLSYAIVRPTLVFGAEDILLNNIAWVLRRFPFFVSAGDGS
jgi:NADH dehydrogenase